MGWRQRQQGRAEVLPGHRGTRQPRSPGGWGGGCTGESSGTPVLWSSAALPSRSKGMWAAKLEMLRHSVRSAGRTARAQVHFKVTRKKRHERAAAPGKGSAGQQRARPGRGCREPAGRCPAPPSTHRRGCRIPSGGTWCAALLCPWRLSQHRGPRALSGAFIGSRQLHALLCGQRRGGECGRGRRETPLGAERAVPYNPPSAAELLRARRRAPPAGRRAVRGGWRGRRQGGGAGAAGAPGPLRPPPPPSRSPSALPPSFRASRTCGRCEAPWPWEVPAAGPSSAAGAGAGRAAGARVRCERGSGCASVCPSFCLCVRAGARSGRAVGCCSLLGAGGKEGRG